MAYKDSKQGQLAGRLNQLQLENVAFAKKLSLLDDKYAAGQYKLKRISADLVDRDDELVGLKE